MRRHRGGGGGRGLFVHLSRALEESDTLARSLFPDWSLRQPPFPRPSSADGWEENSEHTLYGDPGAVLERRADRFLVV